jgi:hypothetical protein
MLPRTTTTDDLSPKIRGEGGTSERDRPICVLFKQKLNSKLTLYIREGVGSESSRIALLIGDRGYCESNNCAKSPNTEAISS